MKRIATLLGTLLIGALPHLAQAQNFPTRPITIVVPTSAGGKRSHSRPASGAVTAMVSGQGVIAMPMAT